MTQAARHIVRTGRNGELDGMSVEDATSMVDRAISSERIVLHFHGGLDNRAAGERIAANWLPVYQAAGADPIFFVWESGFLETVLHNLDEIAKEVFFQRLLRRVLQFAVGKARQDEDERAVAALPVPTDREVEDELRKPGEPYDELSPADVHSELTEEEQLATETAVQNDPALQEALASVVASQHPAAVEEDARGATRITASAISLIDPDVLNELADEQSDDERSVTLGMWLAKKAGQILYRVIQRCRNHTDSGIYTTVLEEIVRAFYLANAGGAVWKAMKTETWDTFQPADRPRAGRTVLDQLATRLRGGARPEITLVGHSTGAVFINNLLDAIARRQVMEGGFWPDEVALQVVMLAPAATFAGMSEVWPAASPRIRRLRMFTMYDKEERADRLLGVLYPRSLLYFVSGVVERDRRDESAVAALVGLNRYYGEPFGGRKDLQLLRSYLGAESRVVLSPTPTDAPIGRRSSARSHTAFNNDPAVMASVGALIDGSAS